MLYGNAISVICNIYPDPLTPSQPNPPHPHKLYKPRLPLHRPPRIIHPLPHLQHHLLMLQLLLPILMSNKLHLGRIPTAHQLVLQSVPKDIVFKVSTDLVYTVHEGGGVVGVIGGLTGPDV